MKKVVAVLWHTTARRMRAAIPKVADQVELVIYSARALSDGTEDFDLLCQDMDSADFFLFNRTSGDSIWPEIENYVKGKQTITAYIGSDALGNITDAKMLEISAHCNEYHTYSGMENMVNLARYCAYCAGDTDIVCEPPRQTPWEGLFHPHEPDTVYTCTEDYFSRHPRRGKGVVGLLTSRSNWINGDMACEHEIISLVEQAGYSVLPMYTYSWPEPGLDAKGPAYTLEKFCFDADGRSVLDGLIKMTGFFIGGRNKTDNNGLLTRLGCPVFKPICSVNMSVEEWEDNPDGTIKDVAWSIALPELEGNIEPIFIGGTGRDNEYDMRVPVDSRCKKLVDRVLKWVDLRHKPNSEKKVVFILNNNPCASVEATVGGGAKLDTLESVARILHTMREAGYRLTDIPSSGEELITTIMERKAISDFRWTTVGEIIKKGGVLYRLTKEEYLPWFMELPEKTRAQMVRTWGEPIGEEIDGVPPAMVYEDTICVTGVSYGNALVCVQPKRGCAGSRCDGTVCKILHDPHCPPTHQYFATYRYFERIYQADVIVHVGTHGNLEFLPGKGTGLSDSCFPDICIGTMPNLYIYNADNPPEGTIAKRRALATIVDHMQTVYIPGGLYEDLEQLDQLVQQYEQIRHTDHAQAHQFQHQIVDAIEASKLKEQIKTELTHSNMDTIVEEVHRLLTLIRNTQIQDGMHIFGDIPSGEKRIDLLHGILRYEGNDDPGIRRLTCKLLGLDFVKLLKNPEVYQTKYRKTAGAVLEDVDHIARKIMKHLLENGVIDSTVDEKGVYTIENPAVLEDLAVFKNRILDLNGRIDASTEMENLLEGANGIFIEPGASGVVTRGRDDVIPTGRNFYTLDPDTVPTRAAWVIGQRLGDAVMDKYLADEGRYPESFGIYWMCNDLLWGGGEGMAQMLYLMGVKPKWRPNGKVTGFEIIPLEQLGRPRIDVSVKLSGILRDNFQSRIELLDRAILEVAALDEPPEQNYVRKHTLENLEAGLPFEEAASRLFGARPGTYLNGITLQIYASAWKERKEMVDVYTFFNGYSYSKGSYGKEAYKVLQNSLKTVDITYNKVMTDEHDLLGCCCYYGVQGGMTAAARELSGKDVKTYYGDSREANDVQVRTMAEELGRVVQSKLLNPKWIEGQKRHGYKGAGDISKRIGRVYGWEATTDEVGDWIFDEITRTYIENQENLEFFKENNPWAMEEIQRRLIEGYERGLWQPADGLLDTLQESYLEIEGILEDSMGDGSENFQGGAIDVKELGELDAMKHHLQHMHDMLK